jgi:hypothetical protein
MSSKDFKPWWEKVNNYLEFQERDEFVVGVSGYRPNNKQEALMGLLLAGYVNNKFEKPEAHTGKKKQ